MLTIKKKIEYLLEPYNYSRIKLVDWTIHFYLTIDLVVERPTM